VNFNSWGNKQVLFLTYRLIVNMDTKALYSASMSGRGCERVGWRHASK